MNLSKMLTCSLVPILILLFGISGMGHVKPPALVTWAFTYSEINTPGRDLTHKNF